MKIREVSLVTIGVSTSVARIWLKFWKLYLLENNGTNYLQFILMDLY